MGKVDAVLLSREGSCTVGKIDAVQVTREGSCTVGKVDAVQVTREGVPVPWLDRSGTVERKRLRLAL